MIRFLIIACALLSATAFLPSKIAFRPPSSKVVLADSGAKDAESLKESIASFKACSNVSRTDINELVIMLEKSAPLRFPAESKLLNGVWTLTYSGFGTPGLLVFQVLKALIAKLPFQSADGSKIIDAEDVTLTISSVQPRVEATTKFKVGGASVDVTVVSELAGAGSRLTEKFVSATVGSIKNITLPAFIKKGYSREVIVTYLDEDLLIVRDSMGSPEILMRQSMEFMPSSETAEPM